MFLPSELGYFLVWFKKYREKKIFFFFFFFLILHKKYKKKKKKKATSWWDRSLEIDLRQFWYWWDNSAGPISPLMNEATTVSSARRVSSRKKDKWQISVDNQQYFV